MRAFLLAEDLDIPYADGMLVAALTEDQARNIAAATTPKRVAQDGKNLWQSRETACIELGELPSEVPEGTIMKGSIVLACTVQNGNVYRLGFLAQEQPQSFLPAL